MKERIIWALVSLALCVLAGVLQGRVSNGQEALAFGWEKYVECMVAEPALYGQTCSQKGALCSRNSECCSESCVRWRCK